MAQAPKTVQLGDANGDPVTPYIFVGLGGSGKQILVQLRRLMLETFGTFDLPHMKFLCIDTDLAGVRVDIKEDNPYYGKANFQAESQIVDAKLTTEYLSNLYANQVANSHIFSWFDPILQRLGTPTNGAAQIRSFGRLAFFKVYRDIREKLTRHLDDINGIDLTAFNRNHGVPLNRERPQVWVVHSVAGGTGSGMFLDCAFLMREIARERGGEIELRSLCLLPDLWTLELSDRRYANAYAALKELDYFNYRRGDVNANAAAAANVEDRFRVAWTPELYAQKRYVHPPVFDTTYLVGANSVGNHAGAQFLTGDKRIHLTQSLADWLYQVSCGRGVSTALASNLSNQLQAMVLATELVTQAATNDGRVLQVRQDVARAYGSVGISRLFFPTQRIMQYQAHKIAAQIVNRWLDGRSPPAPGEAIARHEAALMIEAPGKAAGGEIGGSMRDRLGLNDQNEKTVKTLALDFEKLRQKLESKPTRDGAMEIIEDYLEYGRKWLGDEGIEADRGNYWRDAFTVRLPKLKEELTVTLHQILEHYFKTPNARSVHALNALSEIDARLVEVEKNQAELAKEATKKIDEYRRRYDQLIQYLDGKENATARTVARVAVDQLRQSAEWRLHRIHHNATIKLASALRVTVSNLQARIPKLDTQIGTLYRQLAKAEVELGTRIDPCHYEQVKIDLTGIGSTLKDRDGAIITDERVAYFERNWYAGDMAGGPWGMRDFIADDMDSRALDYAASWLEPITDGTFDVLKTLRETSGLDEVRRQMQSVARNSSIRIGRATAAHGYQEDQDPPVSYTFVIRSGTADRAGLNAAREALANGLLGGGAVQEVSGPADAVTVIQYQVAIPLAKVGGINDWRKTYADLLASREDDTRRVVHVFRSIDTLTEIIALDEATMEARLEAVETVLLTVISGICQGTWGAGEGSFVSWFGKDGPPYFERFELGRLQTFVQRVQSNRGAQDRPITHLQGLANDCKLKYRREVEYCAKLYLLADAMRRAMKPPAGVAKPLAGLVCNGIPGWKEGVDRLIEKLASEHGHDVIIEQSTALLQTLDEWSLEAPAGSGFRQLRETK